MIDQYIQFLLIPITAIAFQIVLFLLNMHVLKNSIEYKRVQVILWLILSIIIFPSIWGIVAQAIFDFTLVLISLCITLTQILYNIEHLFKLKQEAKKRRY